MDYGMIKRLNLVNSEGTEIRYYLTRYSDGQIDINLSGRIDVEDEVEIVARINSYEDLILVVTAADAVRRTMPGVKLHLNTPCMYGQRGDRPVTANLRDGHSALPLKIITDIINSVGFESVVIMSPHSDVLPALLNNCIVASVNRLYSWAFDAIEQENPGSDFFIVSPDAGAYKWVTGVAETFKKEVIPCIKRRGKDGEPKVTVAVPLMMTTLSNTVITIVDDYCDGGRTFVSIAKNLKTNYGVKKVYLVVTHALFSYGVEALEGIDRIYCTNSIKNMPSNNGKVAQLSVI